MTDDDIDYNEDDEEEGSGFFRWLQTAVVLFALVGFFGLAWYAYKSGDNVDEKDVELIKVEKAPIKEAPANPGGMQIPNQDKTVYSLVDGNKTDKPVAERIMPAPEEPVLHENAPETWVNDKSKTKDAALTPPPAPKNAEQFSPAKKEAKVETPAPAAPAPVKTEEAPAIKPAPISTPAPVKAPVEAEEQEAAPAATPAKLPKVRIQLGALLSDAEAQKEWQKLVKKFPDELKGKQHYVVRVSVKGKTYYRLQSGPFNSAKEAEETCVNLVSSDQACITAKDK